ncbi:MAG: ATP-dependent DNA helicase RecG [Candidatus Magasanikbacteria bacterium]|nr:ATP-dependent DNA helicase RecG [Candidatus Magasanikbacteria bacterium]
MKLQTPVSQLNRVGKVLENKLARLGVYIVGDLLMYFPFRYEDYSNVATIDSLKDGQQVTIKTTINLISSKRSPRQRKIIIEALVSDDTGELRLVWFGQPFIKKVLSAGDTVYFSGKVTDSMFGMQMISPSYEKIKKNVETAHTARIVPLYPLTAGITHKQIRFLLKQIIDEVKTIPDWLPQDICERADIMPYSEALHAIHFPENQRELDLAEKRLKFDELFILQLRAVLIRASHDTSIAPQLTFKEKDISSFVSSLPFTLTKDQKIAAWKIISDLEKKTPMNRLLEGDVGAGKTVVAGLVALNAIKNGLQVVMMAPTEILARQHVASLKKLFKDIDISIALVVASETSAIKFETTEKTKIGKKREVLAGIKAGKIHIMVGTHALLSQAVEFHDLGLVIVDEQHRFGVEQRKILKEKSGNVNTTPHFLSMTATPIPRSFALTMYGELDISIIKTMPSGRKKIKTRLVEPHHRDKAYTFIAEQVGKGRQVFVICPLIQENEEDKIANAGSEKKTVMAEYEKLSTQVFPNLRVSYIHGKMKTKEKDEIMQAFGAGDIDILVSTSVVEVGVDIPNASVMMIEGSDRFGLAQLHQFRGRVGRGEHQSYCFVFTDSDSKKALDRLQFFESTIDGFALAEHDLETRGPGDVYGTSQSGMMQLRIATMQDTDIIELARDIAVDIDLNSYPTLKEKIVEWEKSVHLE